MFESIRQGGSGSFAAEYQVKGALRSFVEGYGDAAIRFFQGCNVVAKNELNVTFDCIEHHGEQHVSLDLEIFALPAVVVIPAGALGDIIGAL